MKKGRSILGKVKVHKQWPTSPSSSSLRKAANAAARFASHDGQRPLCLQLNVNNFTACLASKSCEARFGDAAVKVAGDDGIDEASPESVFFLEVLLPDGLDVLVVGLE